MKPMPNKAKLYLALQRSILKIYHEYSVEKEGLQKTCTKRGVAQLYISARIPQEKYPILEGKMLGAVGVQEDPCFAAILNIHY